MLICNRYNITDSGIFKKTATGEMYIHTVYSSQSPKARADTFMLMATMTSESKNPKKNIYILIRTLSISEFSVIDLSFNPIIQNILNSMFYILY